MFPRNSATPPSVAVGSIYLIADGTIQTSGASVRVRTAGGAWGAGAGTLDYDITSGAIEYTPTQAETNGEWFMVAVYKASCTTVCQTVVTSESATAGRAGADLKAILATALTETQAGYLSAALKKFLDVAVPVLTAASVNQTGDAYARLGEPDGASVSADIATVQTEVNKVPRVGTTQRYVNVTTGGDYTGETEDVEIEEYPT